MSKPMSEQMQQVMARYAKATGKKFDQKTNADHIRSMTYEELAAFLECFEVCHHCSEHERLENEPLLRGERCDEDCENHMLDWLKQPYKADKEEA